ncbi:uncharacterized protein F4822DRAFT_430669 [Hypoxylon trugodes]|uniref:uncharacterized protein n=1 Tax=Hypoxylon trugodes TaxID=326681 RepID=UPI0021A1ED30|nr:uncharacterized protein F4822DRAFT_430669 [Hypoxylon trugodes]KAI1387921.1 hypothetical protein F4822DRAFT_430669 [Hypoxylon trugodes]
MAGAPPEPSSSKPSSQGAIVTALCVALAILIFFAALRVRRAAALSMIRETGPRKRLPTNRVDSIPLIKYTDARKRYLKNNTTHTLLTAELPGIPPRSDPTTLRVSGPNASRTPVNPTIQQRWKKFFPGLSNTPQPTTRDIQQSCPTCTEDFLNDDNVRWLPCGHIFHPRCIDPWFKGSAVTCPLWQVPQLCKRDIVLTQDLVPSSRFDVSTALVDDSLQRPPRARISTFGSQRV